LNKRFEVMGGESDTDHNLSFGSRRCSPSFLEKMGWESVINLASALQPKQKITLPAIDHLTRNMGNAQVAVQYHPVSSQSIAWAELGSYFMRWCIVFLLLFMLVVPAGPASGQEIYFLGGVIGDSETADRSYTWALEYMQGLTKYSAFSVSWLNEGHLPNNRRDGISAQLWGRLNVLHQRFSLEAGIGPYFFYDTKLARGGGGFSNTHGVGAVASLAGVWYTEGRWLVQLRANWIETSSSIDTGSVMLGIGYQLDAPPIRGPLAVAPVQRERMTQHEMTVLIGQTIVNSFDSQQSTAQSIEYRHGLARYLDVTIAWLNEGDSRLLRRNGLITQLWAMRGFFDDRIVLGIGFGPYISIDSHSEGGSLSDESGKAISGIISLTASYRISRDWAVRLSWNRIATGYNRDTDVLMAGPSYRF
jgi:hypothetical protein